MVSTTYQSTSGRRRIGGVALALVIELLVALVILQLGTGVFTPRRERPLKTFDVLPDSPAAQKTPSPRKRAASRQRVQASAAPSPPPPVAPPPVVPPVKPKYIQLNPEDYASSDIGRIPSQKGDGEGDEHGKDSAAAYGPGEGPGGATLYNVEWYREPSDAELKPYLRDYAKAGEGWAIIACRTAPDYRVENCRSLEESPPGSGLSRALRLAAWQFRVRPPRLGGKSLIGGWVRIRFDLTVGFRK